MTAPKHSKPSSHNGHVSKPQGPKPTLKKRPPEPAPKIGPKQSKDPLPTDLPADEKPAYLLRLYIVGASPIGLRAVANVRKICEEHLKGRYSLEVLDITKQPELAAAAQILAAPTLIKQLPLPLRRFIGDLSETDRLLYRLDLAVEGLTPQPA